MRNETVYNTVVGITENNEVYLLNYIFNYDDGSKGATGSILLPLTQDDVDQRNDLESVIDSYGYLWTEAVASGNTTDSQEDYMQGLIDAETTYGGSLFLGHDDSDTQHITREFQEEHFPDAVGFECIGGGRIFDHGMTFKVLLRPDLMDLINSVEKPKRPKTSLKVV